MSDVKVQISSCKLSEPFSRFAVMLASPERMELISINDPDGTELMGLIRTLKKYAWEKAGGVYLLTFGDKNDKS